MGGREGRKKEENGYKIEKSYAMYENDYQIVEILNQDFLKSRLVIYLGIFLNGFGDLWLVSLRLVLSLSLSLLFIKSKLTWFCSLVYSNGTEPVLMKYWWNDVLIN